MIVVVFCGTVLLTVFMVALSLPSSKLRNVVIQICGWAFAFLCGIYVISPIDILPEAFLGPIGLIDDVGAVIAGIFSARAALKAGREPLAIGDGNDGQAES
jgi:uncharacterized membrane protein YkvA (DUF1232 family)